MEFHTDLYKRAFSKLTASPDRIKEVIEMTENKKPKRFILRRAAVTASVVALAFAVAAAANAASGGALLARVISSSSYVQGDQCITEMVIEVDDGDAAGGAGYGQYEIEQKGEDGKAILFHLDENGNRVDSQEIDLEDASGVTFPVFRLEDSQGSLAPIEVSHMELDEDHEKITIRYKDASGGESTAVLVVPESHKGFASFGELLAEQGGLTGQTEDGRQFEITAGE